MTQYRRDTDTDVIYKKIGDAWVPIDEPPQPPAEIQPAQPAQPPTTQRAQGESLLVTAFHVVGRVLESQSYRGSEEDRARAFWIMTRVLSLIGVAAGLYYAYAIQSAPWLSITAFTTVMLSLIVSWLIAYLLYLVRSPHFITLLLSLGLLGVIRDERRRNRDR